MHNERGTLVMWWSCGDHVVRICMYFVIVSVKVDSQKGNMSAMG